MAVILKKVISIILSIMCFFTSNNILGGIVSFNPGDSSEDKSEIVTQGITGEESTFFSKLDVKKIGIESSVNAGNWDSAKTGFLNYCRDKFLSLDFIKNHSGQDGSYRTAMYDTLCFSENLIATQTVSSTTLSKITFPISISQLSSTYLLATLKNSSDTGIFMRSKDYNSQYAPTLIFHMKDGSVKSVTANADAYIRATGNGQADSYASTAYGNANKNELWAMHCVDKDNQMPYSSNEMRTYLRFDYSSINMSDVSKVDLSVYAQLKNPNGGSASASELPLVLMVPYTKTWDENTVTWSKIADENGFGHYSWDGFDGIIYNETLYGELDSKLHVPSEYVNATARFSELTSLCLSGQNDSSYYDKARSFLLRFCEQTYDVIATASKGVGGFPKNRPLEPANRCLEFPYIYKTLLEQNKLSAEDNYKIIKWYYQNMRYIYNENSQKIWTDGSTPNEATAEYISNWGFWHLCGYFFGFSFFDEFKEVPEWKEMFESRLAITAGKLVNNDGSYIEVTLGYPVGVVSHCVELIKCMDSWNYTSNSYDLLRKRAAQIVQYLVTCAYSNGILPEYGDGGTGYVKNAIDTLMKIDNAKQYIANNYPEILWYYTNGKEGVKPQKSYVYKDAKLVTDRTGWTADDSMLFYNAKGGGQHAHHDALSLLFYTKGREMLFDPGTITYDPVNPAFSMRTMPSAHNTVEVDGLAQNSKGKTVAEGYDGDSDNINMYANDGVSTIRSYTTANPGATHYRNVTYLKDFGGMILVNDKLVPNDSNSHTYTQNWHVKSGANPKVTTSMGQFNDNVWGYTSFSSGSNLVIAQSLTTRNAAITPAIKSGYDFTSSSGKSDYFEFEQNGSGNVCFDTAIYAYDSTDSSKGIRINKLSTGTDDSVSSSMRVMMFADKELTKFTGDVVYHNSFESTPSLRRVCRRVDSVKGYNGYSTNASNALYHIKADETIDMLSISNGTSLVVYNSKASDMSTQDDILARVETSETVKDLSVKYNSENGTFEISSSDMGVINGTTKVTVNFCQLKGLSKATLNGRTLISGTNVTILSDGVKIGTDNLYFDFTNDSRAVTRYKDEAYGSGKYKFDTNNWNNRIGTISFTPINSGYLSQQVINKDGYDGFAVTYIQPTADGTTGKNSACLNYNISNSDIIQIKLKLRGAAAKSSTTVQALVASSFGSSDFNWIASPSVSGASLSDSYSAITIPLTDAMKNAGNIITFRIVVAGLTQTASESYIDYDLIYIGKTANAPSKSTHALNLLDTDGAVLYSLSVGYGSGYGNLPVPSKPGFIHVGWFTTPTGGTKLDENATVLTKESETYYAHWEKYSYDISYELAGGTLPSGLNAVGSNSGNKQRVNPTEVPIEQDSFDIWIKIENPKKTGYTFDGWNVTGMDNSTHHYWQDSHDNTTTVASWSKIKFLEMYNLRAKTGTVTFTANWTPISSTVTFNANGGSCGTSSKTVAYDSTYGTLPPATKANYTFVGWFTESTGGTQITDSTKVSITSAQTLYAHYSINSYTVKFMNGDTVLQSSKWDYGTTPTYNGATPTKQGNAQYSYTFTGWSPTVSAVTGDVTYTAQFSTSVNKYTVTWKNYDGKTLETDSVPYGTTPTFDGATPTKQGNAQYSYTFTGWSPTVSAVTGDTTYTAQFSTKVNTYTVTWKNYDGKTLETDSVPYGTTPTYDGETPTKQGNAQYSYTFTGWSSTVSAVTGDVTYTAQYSSTVNSYTVKWVNFDGTVIEVDKNVEYGTVPAYNSQTPYRYDDNFNRYHFIGWSSEITPVTGDTVYTAVYESESIDFVLGSDSTLVINKNLGLIFGFSEDKLTEEFIKSSFENEDISVKKVNGKIGTGTKIILNDKFGEPMNTLTVVVIGDVNGDGKYDGMDSVIVSCLANGMLTKEQVGLAVYKAADANHDSEVNQIDVELLANAGLGLEVVNQKNFDSNEDDVDIEIGDLSISG